MNTARLLDRVAITTTATGILLAATVPAAYAGPAPLGPEPSGGGRGLTESASSAGTTLWEVLTIGAAGAVLAIVVALVVFVAASHRTVKNSPARTA